MGVAPWVALVLTLITVSLFHLLLIRLKEHRRRRHCKMVFLPPGSMGLPLIGETIEFFTRSPSLDLLPFFKQRLQRYGRIFKTNLVGKDLIVSLDPELNNYLFQQEEKAFQIWFPESFMRILGDENLVLSSGSFHKNIRNMILRVFGPENLRLVLLHDVQGAVKRSLNSWLEMPSIELKPAISSVWTSQLSFKQAPASINKALQELEVIHESLRLANIAPVLFRKAKQDVHIKGIIYSCYTIPEGWTVMVCLSAVHLNPTAYEDPCVFNPWRWKSGVQDISEPVGGSKDFIAFGSGLRFCVGADFAKLQTAVFLHFFVTNYRYSSITD
ncbi:hypothetical protein HU200_014930 [Digitaria exilis]|uniref:Cytochrome P450 n=1 Tax=Digitaria exilis TaxID=1010633 RepID=A0A835FAS4_9POAL|nr:hypothetical protein HU200_014930 [Digitaria exilis]